MAKSKKKDALSDIQGIINQAKEQIQSEYAKKNNYIPSIVEFVDSPEYLGFSAYNPPVKLFPMQRIMLKVFYRGTVGNENLTLTEEEVDLIQKYNLTNDLNGDLLGKYLSEETFRELILVWGRRCVSEDTEIVDPETGRIWTFGELWNYGRTEIDAWTYDEETRTMRRIGKANIVQQGERQVYLVETNSGLSIEVTENQPLMTEQGWMFVSDIKPGMKIGIAPEIPFFGSSLEIDIDEAAVLGYLSSSKMTAQRGMVSILTDNANVISDFEEHAHAVNPQTSVQSNSYAVYSPHGQTCRYIVKEKDDTTKGESLTSLISENGLLNKSRQDKFVPHRIFMSGKHSAASYLRALIVADGEVSSSDGGVLSPWTMNISVSNNRMAREVQHLLHRFGIVASLKETRSEQGRHVAVTFEGDRDFAVFVNDIGTNNAKLISEFKGKKTEERGLFFTHVYSIRKNGKKATYDLEVSDTPYLQNFCANGFICHNSGKDFTVSIIALYEAMKLLEAPGGNPHAMYHLSGDVPFTILSIANSAGQAGIVYNQIREKMLKSPYFDGKYLPEGVTSEFIYLLTPEDKKMNVDLEKRHLPKKRGSIQIRIGHSESNTLVGLDCFVILFDEIGLYKNTDGSSSGDALYYSLTPALQTYVRQEPLLDEYGNQIVDSVTGEPKTTKVYDGKVVCISTPRGQEGIFYELYKDANSQPHRLMCRMPTWVVNTWHSEESLKKENANMSDDKFNMEFGAMFSGTAGESFFTKEVVDHCFREKLLRLTDDGMPGKYYFAHLDPATSSHNYAMCICHKEPVWNAQRQQRDFVVIVDHLKFWSPSPTKPIDVEEVDEYILKMNRRFFLYLVTYDAWESHQSILKLRRWGIPARKTPFNRHYKRTIYDNFEQLAMSGRLLVPEFPLLRSEMYNLQRKYPMDGGDYKVMPKKDADVATDDCCDAVAGAIYNATLPVISKLPRGNLVPTPVIPSSDNVLWRSMQGTPLGYGPGAQVARALQNRQPWPPTIRR